jgi:hypothetical protein
LHASSGVLGGTGQSESLGSSEGGIGPNLVLSDAVATLLNSGGGGLGLSLYKYSVKNCRCNRRQQVGIKSKVALTPFFGIVEFLFN